MGSHNKKMEKQYMVQRDKHRKAITQTIPFKKEGGIEKKHTLWSLFIMLLSFSLSTGLLLLSSNLFSNAEMMWAFVIVIIIIAVGILFDTIGVAVTAAEETPFHSMAARKMKGARQSILLIRNASKVSIIPVTVPSSPTKGANKAIVLINMAYFLISI